MSLVEAYESVQRLRALKLRCEPSQVVHKLERLSHTAQRSRDKPEGGSSGEQQGDWRSQARAGGTDADSHDGGSDSSRRFRRTDWCVEAVAEHRPRLLRELGVCALGRQSHRRCRPNQ